MTTTGQTDRSHQPSSRLYDIPSLEDDGSNFQTWKFRIRTVLRMRDLLGYAEGTITDPGAGEGLEEKHAEYIRNEQEAQTQITLTLKDEPLRSVLHLTSAQDIWSKLAERYEGKGKHTVARLIGELFRGTLSDEEPLESQLNEMRQKVSILASLEQKLDDSLVAVAMVISLPPSYSVLRTILMSTTDKLATDTVVNAILTEEKTRQDASATALLAKTSQAKQKSAKWDERKKKRCDHCHKLGHVKSECRRLQAEEAAKPTAPKDSTDAKTPSLSAKVAALDNVPYVQLFMADAFVARADRRIRADELAARVVLVLPRPPSPTACPSSWRRAHHQRRRYRLDSPRCRDWTRSVPAHHSARGPLRS